MKLFADTAALPEIEYCFSRGVSDGITTNPMIIKQSGDLSQGFERACKTIIQRYPNVPISLETDLAGLPVYDLDRAYSEVKETLLKQARQISSWGSNVVVKIPICSAGLDAVKDLSDQGIKTNVTACMSAYQALRAAESGATYVSLFANRMVDSFIMHLSGNGLHAIKPDGLWKKVVGENKVVHLAEAWHYTLGEISHVAEEINRKMPNSQLIVGSIRSVNDLQLIKRAQPHIITIPTGIVREMVTDGLKDYKSGEAFSRLSLGDTLEHPMTLYTIQEFENAAAAYRK